LFIEQFPKPHLGIQHLFGDLLAFLQRLIAYLLHDIKSVLLLFEPKHYRARSPIR